MENEDRIKRYAIHEAGHVLGLYVALGNIDRVDFIYIDETGGFTILTDDFKFTYKQPGINTEQAHRDMFIDACYLLGGGIAVKMIFNEDDLDFDSMSVDLNVFEKIWHENLLLDTDLFKRASEYCEEKFSNWIDCITVMSDRLIRDMGTYHDSGMLYKNVLCHIIEKCKVNSIKSD